MFNLDYFRRSFDFYYNGWDFTFLPFIIIAVIVYAYVIRMRKVDKEPIYRYFPLAITIKLLGGIFFCLAYTMIYDGGDTTLYFWSGKSCASLAQTDFSGYWQILKGNVTAETLSAFNNQTEHVFYAHDPRSFAVVRYTSIFVILAGKSYLWATIFLNLFLFSAFWRFYKLLTDLYPHLAKPLAYGFFLIPSVVFWGSGILKDTYTMAATLWFANSFYYIIIKFDRKKLIGNIFYGVLALFLFLTIKPYILFALVLGLTIWFLFGYIQKVKSPFLRIFVFPFILILAIGGGSAVLMQLSSSAGDFYSSPEAMMNKAAVTQQDLTQDYYGGNSYDIGEFDASYTGIISKAPVAILAGFFRPFPWEARSPLIMLSAIENTFVFFLLMFALFGRGIKNFFKQLGKNHYVIFALTFSIVLSFMVGLTTANFGALVRYKIPFMPFIITALLIVYFNYRQQKKDNDNVEPVSNNSIENKSAENL
jgi:hypothetical protein